MHFLFLITRASFSYLATWYEIKASTRHLIWDHPITRQQEELILTIVDEYCAEHGCGVELLCGRMSFRDLFSKEKYLHWMTVVERALHRVLGHRAGVKALHFSAYKAGNAIFKIFALIQARRLNWGKIHNCFPYITS